MTVGVGIPEAILYEMIAELDVNNKTILPLLSDLIDKEIAAARATVNHHIGVGIYHEHCIRWAHHLEAYERVQDILVKLQAQNEACKRRKGSTAT